MGRSRKDILEAEAMLSRLRAVLGNAAQLTPDSGQIREDAASLRRISMTLHRWHEAECNGDVERDETDGKTYHYYRGHIAPQGNLKVVTRRYSIPDRETGANKRLAKIMTRYPSLSAYVQGDPRGCPLYILRPGDVPADEDVSAYYSRGIAVYR